MNFGKCILSSKVNVYVLFKDYEHTLKGSYKQTQLLICSWSGKSTLLPADVSIFPSIWSQLDQLNKFVPVRWPMIYPNYSDSYHLGCSLYVSPVETDYLVPCWSKKLMPLSKCWTHYIKVLLLWRNWFHPWYLHQGSVNGNSVNPEYNILQIRNRAES